MERIIIPVAVEVAIDPSRWRAHKGTEPTPDEVVKHLEKVISTGFWAHGVGGVQCWTVAPGESK